MVELIAPRARTSGIPASASFAKSLLEYEIIVFWQKGTQLRPLDSDLEFDRCVHLHGARIYDAAYNSKLTARETGIRVIPTMEVERVGRIYAQIEFHLFREPEEPAKGQIFFLGPEAANPA